MQAEKEKAPFENGPNPTLKYYSLIRRVARLWPVFQGEALILVRDCWTAGEVKVFTENAALFRCIVGFKWLLISLWWENACCSLWRAPPKHRSSRLLPSLQCSMGFYRISSMSYPQSSAHSFSTLIFNCRLNKCTGGVNQEKSRCTDWLLLSHSPGNPGSGGINELANTLQDLFSQKSQSECQSQAWKWEHLLQRRAKDLVRQFVHLWRRTTAAQFSAL